MSILSEKIKGIRIEEGVSQQVFAKSLGYSKGYVADIETGRTRPSRKFFEVLQQKYSISIDWLVSDNRIVDLVEANKATENPNILFLYDFTQEGIDNAAKILRDLFCFKKYIIVDAAGSRTDNQLLQKIVHKKGQSRELWAQIEKMMRDDEIILIIKNISLSRISKSGLWILDIFKIMDDAWEIKRIGDKVVTEHKMPKSSLIVLDFPSYLEKNMENFGYYAIPIYCPVI